MMSKDIKPVTRPNGVQPGGQKNFPALRLTGYYIWQCYPIKILIFQF